MALTAKQRQILLGLCLLVVTIVVYIPAIRSGFIWDDNNFLTDNSHIHAADGLQLFWFSTRPPDYFPLTSSMLWFEWRVFGMENPWGYHLINVLLHACSAVLLWRVLLRLAIPGAWFAALIFAIHPVNVESVAWITERKNVLPMVFALASTLFFLRWRSEAKTDPHTPILPYFLSLLCFLLALLAKTSVAMLPVVFLILTWWKTSVITKRDILRTAPFFALSLILSLVTIWYQYNRAIGDFVVRDDPFLSRLAISGRAIWFYLYKALLPFDLRFVYSRWEADISNPLVYVPLLLFIALLVALWFLSRARQGTNSVAQHANIYDARRVTPTLQSSTPPHLSRRSEAKTDTHTPILPYSLPNASASTLTALLIFAAMLFPILGFFNIFFMLYSLVADHWQYPGIAAMIALTVAGGVKIFGFQTTDRTQGEGQRPTSRTETSTPIPPHLSRRSEAKTDAHTPILGNVHWPRMGICLAMILTTLLAIKTWKQQSMYKNEETLYRGIIADDPACWMAQNNLGAWLYEQDRKDEALAQWHAVIRIKPDHPEAHNNIGRVLGERGDDASDSSERTRFHTEALSWCSKAIELRPGWGPVHGNVARLLTKTGGDARLAEYHFLEGLKKDPADENALYDLAVLLG